MESQICWKAQRQWQIAAGEAVHAQRKYFVIATQRVAWPWCHGLQQA